jgi:hypothetical protein
MTLKSKVRRSLAAVAVMVATAATVVTGAPAAQAAACSGNTGVTVVVDFTAFSGGITTGCALGDPATGLAALTGAGFSYSFVPSFPGFICRINTLPNPCNGAPVSAYWSYWHATPGGSWSYSGSGAGSYNPAPGTVEGWAFGSGGQPGQAP